MRDERSSGELAARVKEGVARQAPTPPCSCSAAPLGRRPGVARAPVVGREQELFPSSDLSQLKPDLRASDVARAPMQAEAAPPHCALRRLTHGVRGQPRGPACCPHLGPARAGWTGL